MRRNNYHKREHNDINLISVTHTHTHTQTDRESIRDICISFHIPVYLLRSRCKLTPRNRVLLQNLTVAQLLKKSPVGPYCARVHNSSPLNPVLRHTQACPVHAFMPYFLQIHFKIIPPNAAVEWLAEGPAFKSRTGDRLSWLRSPWFSSVSQGKAAIVP
jgi:hypothetical protein